MKLSPLLPVIVLAAAACSSTADPVDDVDAAELPSGTVEYSALAPVSGGEPSLFFGPPAVAPEGVLQLADGTLFPPGAQLPTDGEPPEEPEPTDEPEPTGLETCALSDHDLTATPIEGLGPVLVTADGQTLLLTMYSPLSKECETIGAIECGRVLTAVALSPDGSTIYLAGAVPVPDGTLPEAVVWRLDLQVTEEGGSAALSSTLVEQARLPCAPTALALGDMNGDGSQDFLASCQQPPPSCHKGECPALGPARVLVKSPLGAPDPAVSPLLLSPVSGISALAAADVDGDGLPDIAAAGANGVARWLQQE